MRSTLSFVGTPASQRWRLLAVAALGFAALLALLLVLGRTPYLGIALPSAQFRTALVLHVNFAITVWLLACVASAWSEATSDGFADRVIQFTATLAALVLALTPLLAPGPAVPSNYLPVLESRLFLTALIVFIGTVLASYLRYLLRPAPRPTTVAPARCDDHVPLVLTGVPMLMAVVSLAWAALHLHRVEPHVYWDRLTWGAGHTIQFTYLCLLMLVWLELAAGAGVRPAQGRIRLAFAIQVAPVFAVPLVHALSPVDQPAFRDAFTSLMRAGAWPGAALLALMLLLEARRARVRLRTLDPALTLSMLFLAAGVLIGAAIRADTSMVPAHYHAAVGAVTIALMGVTLRRLAPSAETVRRRGISPLRLYACGLAILVLALAWSGWHGVTRKSPVLTHPLVTMEQTIGMSAMALGGVLAICGVLMFVACTMRGHFAATTQTTSAPFPRRRDRRAVAIASTLALIGIGGACIAWLPRAWIDAGHSDQDDLVHTRFHQAVASMRQGQAEQAAIALHDVLTLAPQLPEAQVNMGYALLALGRPAAARDFFESATALRASQVNAYYGLAAALEALGDLPGAVGAMRTFVHLSQPADPFVRKAQAALWEWESELARQRQTIASKASSAGVRP